MGACWAQVWYKRSVLKVAIKRGGAGSLLTTDSPDLTLLAMP